MMRYGLSLTSASLVAVACLLVSCGSGGGGGSDIFPWKTSPDSTIAGPNSFLLFPNPQVQSDGSLQTDTVAYAQAYYAAIDPASVKDMLAKWRTANGFDSGTGTQWTAVIGDRLDLGYGRRMTARQNTDGTIAVQVDNYLVPLDSGYGYSRLNLDAAVAQDKRWFIMSSCIEFSPGPNGGINFAKFFVFAPDGSRLLSADLDGRGSKAMPGICVNCHGGRADPLTPAVGNPTGQPLFPLVQYSASLQRGDVQAKLHVLKVDSFDYSTVAGYTRADQESTLKAINQMILCSYPLAEGSTSTLPEDSCRRVANKHEWQGGNDTYLKKAYGGDGMPNATYSDTYVPTSWATAGQSSLYQNVIVPGCRTCHLLRGTKDQSDIDFSNYAGFLAYADGINALVMERGNMPLAKIVSENFWSTNMADNMATWLEGVVQGFVGHDNSGALLKPGRPIAYPGPSRVVPQGATTLSAANSLYATTYDWSIVSGPAGGATLTSVNSAHAIFTATTVGTYVVQLVVGNGTVLSAPAQFTVVVNSSLTPAPSAIRFTDIKTVLQTRCVTACHTVPALNVAGDTVYAYNNIDRNGDGKIDATDDSWLYTEVRGVINFTDIAASPILHKPTNYHHPGGPVAGFDTTLAPGDAGRANYDLFLNWILNGAPQ